MKVINCLFAIAFIAVLSSCASTKTMSSQDRSRIHSVYVSEKIELPEEMFYWDRDRSLALGIGVGVGAAAGSRGSASKQATFIGIGAGVGSVVGEQMAAGPRQQIVQKMADADVDVRKILRNAFVNELQATGKMKSARDEVTADGVLTLKVNMYGFGQTQGFSSVLHPTLNVSASIRDRAGQEIWNKTDYITPHSEKNTVAHTFEEYRRNPTYLREAFSVISKAIAEWIVASIPSSSDE